MIDVEPEGQFRGKDWWRLGVIQCYVELDGHPRPLYIAPLKSLPLPAHRTSVYFGMASWQTNKDYWLPGISLAGSLGAQENNDLFVDHKPHILEFVKWRAFGLCQVPPSHSSSAANTNKSKFDINKSQASSRQNMPNISCQVIGDAHHELDKTA